MSAPSATEAPVLVRLREETRDLHAAVEATVPVLDPRATASDYRAFLARMYGFHVPLERRFDDAAAALALDLAPRRRAELLARDLAALGVEPGALPLCADLPRLDAPAALVGCLYVLEGSTLGGQLLVRELGKRFPEELARASAYLSGHGGSTGERWRELRAAIADHVARVDDADAVVAAARDTFSALARWIAPVARCRGAA